ncbi:COX15 [Symbiodinium sp. KB8]|nr:COX15 [Symbiodinium sp. KB8]
MLRLAARCSSVSAKLFAPLPLRAPRISRVFPRCKATAALETPFADAGTSSSAVAGELVTPGWERAVGLWLAGTCGMLYSMIAIGGYTRLSGSGLSMTDWRLEGRRLPLTEDAWVKEFEEYKKYPEYQRLHAGKMEIDEFKRIYFVEWFHRMWGRTAGLLFALPLGYFAARGVLRARLGARLTGLFGLGLSQAFVGWWMVRSGLDPPETHTPSLGQHQRPRVSPYRLASHWTAALTIYAGCVWNTLSLLRPSPAAIHGCAEAVAAAAKVRTLAIPATSAVLLTLLSGPFVAGNDAGRAYNTWPKMLDDWVPPEWSAVAVQPLSRWRAFFEETPVVQFNHRMLAYLSVASSIGVWAYSMQLPLSAAAASATSLLPIMTAAQMCLGIATLMLYVPIELGVAHQAGGVAVLTAQLFGGETFPGLPPEAADVSPDRGTSLSFNPIVNASSTTSTTSHVSPSPVYTPQLVTRSVGQPSTSLSPVVLAPVPGTCGTWAVRPPGLGIALTKAFSTTSLHSNAGPAKKDLVRLGLRFLQC